MAWSSEKVKLNGTEVAAHVHSAGGLVTVPFMKGVMEGSKITVRCKTHNIAKVINVGNRNETLDVFLPEAVPVNPAPKTTKSKKTKQGDAP